MVQGEAVRLAASSVSIENHSQANQTHQRNTHQATQYNQIGSVTCFGSAFCCSTLLRGVFVGGGCIRILIGVWIGIWIGIDELIVIGEGNLTDGPGRYCDRSATVVRSCGQLISIHIGSRFRDNIGFAGGEIEYGITTIHKLSEGDCRKGRFRTLFGYSKGEAAFQCFQAVLAESAGDNLVDGNAPGLPG